MRNASVRLVLGVLALLLGLGAALGGHLPLFAGLMVLACAAFWASGTVWQFLKLTGTDVVIDRAPIFESDLGHLLAALVETLKATSA